MNPARKFTIVDFDTKVLEILKNPKWSIGCDVNFLTG